MWPTRSDPSFGVFVREQVQSLRRRGVDVDVHVIEGRASSLNYVRALLPLRRKLSSGSFDVVHAHYVLTGQVTWAARFGLAGPPLVVTHHGVEIFTGWQAPLARLMNGQADRILVISDAMASELGLDDGSVIPCGVDLQRFMPGSRQQAREALELDRGAVIVAWVGVDRPEKRLALAREAVRALSRQVPGARLHTVHNRPHAEVALHLQAADALLVTSRWEGGPLVVKEALACNRPVVSTDVGDVAALIADIAGCSIAPADPAALAEALKVAVSLGHADSRGTVRRFSLDEVAAQLEAVYRGLAAQQSGRP